MEEYKRVIIFLLALVFFIFMVIGDRGEEIPVTIKLLISGILGTLIYYALVCLLIIDKFLFGEIL